jgi:N-methylhydantoinase A
MYWVGFDVGGTFVDILTFDTETGDTHSFKHRSSRKNAASAVRDGLGSHLSDIGGQPRHVTRLAHGTTLVTNLLVERAGAKVGVVTTRGFSDILEIGRMRRPSLYDLNKDKPEPLAGRQARFEVDERIDARGQIINPLNTDTLPDIIEQLRQKKIGAVAVCFLHSYVNPVHEELAGAVFEKAGFLVSLSSQVSAEFGEFERFSSAVINSYVMPSVVTYTRKLNEELAMLQIKSPVEIMQSNGGVISSDIAARFPLRLASSGPAAGVIGAQMLASQTGANNLITLDMGGTSTDVSLVVDGRPAYRSEHVLDGYPVRAVSVDIHSIGAGGGSLARLDRTGSLLVGPESAGAEPGPACYGWGGSEPTVADANLVLGYLNPERFCGGGTDLRVDLAKAALTRHIADPRAVTIDEAALGILRVCITNMVGAVRNITMERGYDPRDFTLAAFGGAGPVHASFVAAELNIPEVLILKDPGLLSAKGLLLTNYRADVYRTAMAILAQVDCIGLNQLFEDLEQEAVAQLPSKHSKTHVVRVQRILELCYEGQQNVVPVDLEEFPVEPAHLPMFADRLNEKFKAIFGFVPTGRQPQILHLRVFAEFVLDVERLLDPGYGDKEVSLGAPSAKPTRYREILFAEAGKRLRTPIFERETLPRGSRFDGPAVIEEDYSNTVVGPNQAVRIDDYGNLFVIIGADTRGKEGE